jgi:hypothetical protein
LGVFVTALPQAVYAAGRGGLLVSVLLNWRA